MVTILAVSIDPIVITCYALHLVPHINLHGKFQNNLSMFAEYKAKTNAAILHSDFNQTSSTWHVKKKLIL
jgi:hypothetical protein